MLLVAAIGATAQQFAAKVPTLPGSAQAAMQAAGQAGIWLPALGLHRDAPHRHHLQRHIHRTRGPVDAEVPGDLRQGGNVDG
jgi:hypothetical protein